MNDITSGFVLVVEFLNVDCSFVATYLDWSSESSSNQNVKNINLTGCGGQEGVALLLDDCDEFCAD
ncbi:hypothetical protein DERP_002626 [Dermatophagoides pteronyssinus]|uniref:Uncharacterized protein n=1 Tax=Dermatophagoides pteronyssinus TaxID=6956 RepID=A0ABQ8JI89_DERPT|nr:hypothetical protein DERP_002626 [Dermatophagoides pteronyssinus]